MNKAVTKIIPLPRPLLFYLAMLPCSQELGLPSFLIILALTSYICNLVIHLPISLHSICLISSVNTLIKIANLTMLRSIKNNKYWFKMITFKNIPKFLENKFQKINWYTELTNSKASRWSCPIILRQRFKVNDFICCCYKYDQCGSKCNKIP